MTIKSRLRNIAITLDQSAWVFITLGKASPDETISAALWRMETQGKLAGRIFRPAVDWVARVFFKDHQHCFRAFMAEIDRRQYPPSYREATKG